MNRIVLISSLMFGIITSGNTQSEEALGLWEVKSVLVGDRDVTPVAKWFDINEDGTVHGGNGGMINISGTWSLIDDKVLFTDDSGFSDPMGGFTFEVAGDEMIWMRVEDDMNVRIKMERVSVYPKGPWDHVAGAWANTANPSHTLYMGWDRDYRMTTRNGRKRGIWHIDAHAPLLKLVAEDGVIEDWTITFPSDTTMQWTADLRDTMNFVRMNPD